MKPNSSDKFCDDIHENIVSVKTAEGDNCVSSKNENATNKNEIKMDMGAITETTFLDNRFPKKPLMMAPSSGDSIIHFKSGYSINSITLY